MPRRDGEGQTSDHEAFAAVRRFLWTEVECLLSGQQRRSYFDEDSRTWRITDHVLDEIKDDLQAIINCTRLDDVVQFDVSTHIRPAARVFIPWSLKLGTRGREADVERLDSGPARTDAPRRTVFSCPRKNEGLFIVRWPSIASTCV